MCKSASMLTCAIVLYMYICTCSHKSVHVHVYIYIIHIVHVHEWLEYTCACTHVCLIDIEGIYTAVCMCEHQFLDGNV